jgi:hypothetical protein
MHEPHPHVEYGGGRFSTISVEYPPHLIVEPQEWKELLHTIVFPEWEDLHPTLKQAPLIVRFVSKLTNPADHLLLEGVGVRISSPKKSEWLMRIALQGTTGRLHMKEKLLHTIVHEIAEADYWTKTSPEETLAHKEIDEEKILRENFYAYFDLPDEKVADARAYRALQRKWSTYYLDIFFNPPDENL